MIDYNKSVGTTTAADEQVNWNGKIQVIRQEENEPSEFIKDLESEATEEKDYTKSLNNAEYASDFNSVYYDRDTVYQINQFTLGDELNKYQYYNQEIDPQHTLDIEDGIRKQMEECDTSQGFQIFSDLDDGFSGLMSRMVTDLAEEYSKSIVVYGITQNKTNSLKQKTLSDMNKILVLDNLLEQATFIPIHLPSVNHWDISSDFSFLYQQSALIGLGIESLNLPTRFNDSRRIDLNYYSSIGKVLGLEFNKWDMTLDKEGTYEEYMLYRGKESKPKSILFDPFTEFKGFPKFEIKEIQVGLGSCLDYARRINDFNHLYFDPALRRDFEQGAHGIDKSEWIDMHERLGEFIGDDFEE
ncbi:mtDNA inheritance, partitioning of the mitochondrial organelle [Boothiomyces macroporosus]|uniref:MtDNA inheritance, partitioning of the mitochondrial organelle n=1 Tax=Boothiomyces macroporosus TaxID=261099 RepID=A0AAD5UKB5_9FUNG|nr:mtDNA inheritance, partitioning of the mitochondrial organelle [Boothiomyces macroporosus]